MTTNAELAELFQTIADLLDLLGEKFKPEAYRRAARSIESLTEDIRTVAARGELRTIPGVGPAIEGKIQEYLKTGKIPYYEKLKLEVPPGLAELMRLPGIGPKTTRRFWVELGVEGPDELRDAINAGKLDRMKGFGAKKIEQVREALAMGAGGAGPTRRPIEEVYPVAETLLAALRAVPKIDRAEVAGSFRRARETVGDLDFLVTTNDPTPVFDAFSKNPRVDQVVMRGGTKETVLLKGGFQVDMRVVEPGEFGAALLYFTGSKDHNVHLRSIAKDRGLKVNEYGVFRGEERVAGKTEEDVYASLGLAWIPPELREDHGEIEAAAHGPLPRLVADRDLRGDLHVHLAPDAEPAAVDRLVAAARAGHLQYLGVVVGGIRADGGAWLLPEATRAHLARLDARGVRILRAVERGPEPLPPELEAVPCDVAILRPTAGPVGEMAPPTSVPVVLVAHVGPSVSPHSSAFESWIRHAKALSAAIEVGPGAERVDSTGGRLARQNGVLLHVPMGITLPPNDPTRPVALGFARRAGATPPEVTNTRAADALRTGRTGSSGPPPTEASRGRPKARSGKRRSA